MFAINRPSVKKRDQRVCESNFEKPRPELPWQSDRENDNRDDANRDAQQEPKRGLIGTFSVSAYSMVENIRMIFHISLR
jgi:hypothetical protein